MNASVNVLPITDEGWIRYLCKYVSKCEPSLKKKNWSSNMTPVEIFLNFRVMGACELADILNGF